MGNTVSRSHIRDADPGVAKATRANTKRNSTGFTNDLAEANGDPLLLHGAPSYPVDAAISGTAALSFGAKPVAIAQHGSKPLASGRVEKDSDDAFGRKPADQLFQDAHKESSAKDSKQSNHIHGSTPKVSGAALSFPENTQSLLYGSSNGETRVAEIAPEAIVADFANLGVIPEHAEMHTIDQATHLSSAVGGSGAASEPLAPPRSVPAGLSTRRRNERPQTGNISFSRNTSSQSLPTRAAGTDSSQTRDLFEEELNRNADQKEKYSLAKARSDEPFAQRTGVNIDPGLTGGTIRDCQNARTSTPPRVDKPPRARKVVSFNENVHVVTYPNEGSSTHSSTAGDIAISRHAEGKLVKKRGRSVFRLLSKVAGPVGFGGSSNQSDDQDASENGLQAPSDTCCGLRLTGVTDLAYDDLSSKRKPRMSTAPPLGTKRLPSAESALELHSQSDLVVSFEKVRYAKGPTTSILRTPGFEGKHMDSVADDFDYCDRRNSDEDEDTLSLSDAHPSWDAIDEPEAIGDQLLSAAKESGQEERVNSSFNIAPLWQRLKRVDELDVVESPLPNSGSDRRDEMQTPTSIEGNTGEVANDRTGNDSRSSPDRNMTTEVVLKAADDRACRSDEASPREVASGRQRVSYSRSSVQAQQNGLTPKSPGTAKGWQRPTRSIDSTSPDGEGKTGAESVATVINSNSSGVEHSSQSDRLSLMDPASDVDPVLALDFGKSPKVAETLDEEKKLLEEFDIDSMPDLQGLTGNWSASTSRVSQGLSQGLLAEQLENHLKAASTGSYQVRIVRQLPNLDDDDDDILPLSASGSAKRSISGKVNSVATSRSRSTRRSSAHESGDDESDGESSLTSDGAIDFGPNEGFFDSIIRSSNNGSGLGTYEKEAMRTNRKRTEPSYFRYPGDVGASFQLRAPLAGVFYGTDSPPPESNADEGQTVDKDLVDYPEYEVLNRQGRQNSLQGTEKETPLLRALRETNEKLQKLKDDQQSGKKGRVSPFEDRETKKPIPEVLLHDWSGRQPIEPSIEMVDSAPNSRSSIPCFPNGDGKGTEQRAEFPNAGPLLSSRLGTNGEGGKEEDRKEVKRPMDKWERRGGALRLVKGGSSGEWMRQKNKSISETNEREGEDETIERGVRTAPYFTSIPGLHPADPKLQDFQVAVERKSYSEHGMNERGGGGDGTVVRGRSFAEGEGEGRWEFKGEEVEMMRRGGKRRIVSNAETSVTGVGREEKLKGVMNRLVNRIQGAKRFVSTR